MVSEEFKKKLLNYITKFENYNLVVALKKGVMFTVPLSLIGSIFILFTQFPVPGFDGFMTNVLGDSWKEPLLQIYNTTMGIMAIVAVMGITYCYVKAKKHEPFMPAIISLVVFLATCNLSVKTSEGEVVNGVINMELLSGKGMVAAIIILITMFIYIFFKNVMNTTFIDFIYQLLQIPLQRVSDSLLGILFITMMISFLWWFGINGSAIVNSVVSSIIAANTLDNQNILNETGTLTVENGAHIVTQQFQAQFVAVTGAGITIGIVVLALLFGKAKETKIMGRLSIIPSLFNINEPVLFGIPIVMNSFLLFPFMIIPIIAVLITYFSIASGLISPFSGVMVPWTTPPILSGFFIGGWKAALLQLVIMIISIVIYYPFFKMQESFRLKVNNEQKVVNAMG